MKINKTEYITWEKPVYLLHLPVLEIEVCDCCGKKEYRTVQKGFIKIGSIKHRRKKTAMDYLTEIMNKKELEYLSTSLTFNKKKVKGGVIKFKRYGKMPEIRLEPNAS